jgi:predicted ATP-dependent serine protease
MPAAGDEALVGRAVELGVLDDFVGSAFRSGGVHLVTGDAGAGKSALLRAAVTAAGRRHGARVLHASGVEFEADLGYAAL